MWGFLRIFYLLLLKNWIVRRRHFYGIITEFLFPVFIIGIILTVRNNYDVEPIHQRNDTHFPVLTKTELIENHIPRSILHLYYKPRNNFTDELMKDVLRCTKLPHNQLFGFDGEEDMLHELEIQQGKDELISILAIDFDETNAATVVPKKFKYTIRSSQKIPTKLFDQELPETASDDLINTIPIVSIQMCLNDVFIDKVAPAGVNKPTLAIQKMPNPPHDTMNSSEVMFQYIVYIYGGIIFLATIRLIPTFVGVERINGVNALLKMNGVKSWQNYLSWLVMGMLLSPVPISAVTLFLKLDFGNSQKPFYQYSDFCVIWLLLFLNVIHIHAFCLHVTSYFCKAWAAQLSATIILLFANVVFAQLEDSYYINQIRYFGFLFPSLFTMRIFSELNAFENTHIGAHWDNIFETANHQFTENCSLGHIMLYSIFSTILHFILAVYVDVIIPNKYGVAKRPLFFLDYFTTSWHPNKVCCNYDIGSLRSSKEQPEILEQVADGTLTPGVSMRNLAKCFACGSCRNLQPINAVRNINMDFYKGQITALLGHNGAGKTTTFSMLTGLTPPSEGTIYINNKDITKDLDGIQSDLGLCPQENMMFPDLTVLEQLRFIGLLKQKNKTKEQVIRDVDDLLNKLGISEKRNVMTYELSGGQKRRVCLGMALIGNASTIFLDEPTSGMDPETCRDVWDLILKYRNQKTIIITTHSMEEADVLGDRIAIMQSGKVKCYGSPMFLKKHYGHNFHEVTLSTTTLCDKEKIRNMVGSDAKMNDAYESRIVISIPFTSSLPQILDKMEKQKAELGITGISVSLITLEQVFLRAAEEEASNEFLDDVDGTEQPKAAKVQKYLTGSALTRQRIFALIMKKFTYLVTNYVMFLTILIGALLAVLLPEYFLPNPVKTTNIKPLSFHLYPNTEALIHFENKTLADNYEKVIEELGGRRILTQVDKSLSDELLSRARKISGDLISRTTVATEFNSRSSANGFYSGIATYSAPLTVNVMSNAILKTLAGDEYSISARIADLPQPFRQDAAEITSQLFRIITRALLFIIIFVHLVSLFVKHPLLENRTKFKQLQQMTGVSPLLYWGTTFVFDYAFYVIVSVSMAFLVFYVLPAEPRNKFEITEISILLLMYLLFGINALLFAYVHSFIKKQFHIVYSILCSVPLFTTFVTLALSKLLQCLGDVQTTVVVLRRVFSLMPHVSYVFGYVKFTELANANARCRQLSDRLTEAACAIGDMCCDMKCSNGVCENPLPYFNNFREEGGVEEFVIYLSLTPIIFVGIIWWLEHRGFAKLKSNSQIKKPKSGDQIKATDCEVENEKLKTREAINRHVSEPNGDDDNVFMAYELSKCYGKLEAVQEVSFSVKQNECFGLLGVNGAGKSTTFRMLVGEEIPNTGILHRGSYSIKSDRTKYLEGIGYCPQTDALIPYFNAEEHLSLFARLRGIPSSKVKSEVRLWIDKLKLNKHAENPIRTYSGGNKRRLNIALALIASPELVLLDEPTTGVDPAARRLVRTVLQDCQKSGQAIILTSHSMEECEALCNRLVIMVQGRLLCIGASQELKERFGAGFNITIKMNPLRSLADYVDIKNKIEGAFVCELKDEHPGYLFYHITNCETTWVDMFGTMNALKSEYKCIEDFTVSTSTLEQLFMQFARSFADPPAESHVESNVATA